MATTYRWAAAAVLTMIGSNAVLAAASAEGEAAGTPLYPDIIEEVPHHLQIQNTQQGEFLRFSTTHINVGAGNLQIRGGGEVAACVIDGEPFEQCTIATQELLDADGRIAASQPAGVALFHPEHNHWHQSDVAEFAIKPAGVEGARLDPLAGEDLVTGTKVTFCFVDVKFTGATGSGKKSQPRTYWECNGELQGVSAGWGDSYHQSTPLQELDVTGIAPGDYYLTHEADPDNHWTEDPAGGEDNNFTWVLFRLGRDSANAQVEVLGHSDCVVAVQCGYGGNP
jgi:Lysyl oxidase